MKRKDVLDLVHESLMPALSKERDRVRDFDKYLRNRQSTAHLPRRAGREHRYLADISRTPWLRLVVNSAVQMLYAESVFSAERDVKDMWKPWERNQFQSRQIPLYRDAIAFGDAYVSALPGDTGAVLRPYSPMEMMAFYGDPVEDEWPIWALRATPSPDGKSELVRVIDEEKVYFVSHTASQTEFVDEKIHGVGVCPVVRYSPRMDLMGRSEGDVEPYISVAKRLDKTEYDRLLAQHYNSWRIKTATKLDADISDEDAERIRMKLSHEDILVGTGETEFGTLDVTPLADLNLSKESHVETLAATSQTSTTALSGKMVNVSADGLAESKASAYAKRDEFQATLGGSHVKVLRLAAQVEGRTDDAGDYSLEVSWADTETRTLNQAVDALGKASVMLGVPPELLWELIPGISQTKADAWKHYAEENPPLGLTRDVEAYLRQSAPTYEATGGDDA